MKCSPGEKVLTTTQRELLCHQVDLKITIQVTITTTISEKKELRALEKRDWNKEILRCPVEREIFLIQQLLRERIGDEKNENSKQIEK